MHKQATALTISPTAADYARANRAPNTLRAYRAAWRAFAAWCAEHKRAALPADPLTVADYLAAAAQHHKASTLGIHVAAIAAAHKAAGYPNPAADERVKATLTGIRRVHGQPPAQRDPLTLDDLRALGRACGDSLAGLRDRALLFVGWAAALRRSEIVALDVEHVRLGEALHILILRRKTDQEGQGTHVTIPRLADPELCPVRALRAWLDATGIRSGAIFRSVNRWGKLGRRLSPYDVARIVKRRAKAVGLDARMLAGHSLRAGFITQAALQGVDILSIAEVSGHKDMDVLRQYVRAAGRIQAEVITRVMDAENAAGCARLSRTSRRS
jgi:site-specific recombinase XerD